ncbi:hypothetical protein PF005_g12847 [Phytophthora fragariae]|uniref:Uncharacterized protein n=1 Tax=Phytophthora fragariae TaxID=53985 RepID=A0A6A3Y136_9STRA|nr:hypothetical protein PF011_g11836 [Phytophthora fragariae]KAE9105977.1 hypothetical protein PF010_g12795 [Phytophthora fragariae]KAE9142708.1 hypothetical protein PF006_g12203 [Phytophthora fragariae]KAE9206881.1 hypothetical protein PF005_g12847 [Phytophthora fragariae]KAE9257408.1 hypothetical protein PF002_g1071 [Phytophthora fragariae]
MMVPWLPACSCEPATPPSSFAVLVLAPSDSCSTSAHYCCSLNTDSRAQAADVAS